MATTISAESPKLVSCFAHLPLLRLPAGMDDHPLPDGWLTRLPAEKWARLDRTANAHRDGFERTAPVFFQMDFAETEPVDPDETFGWVRPEFDQELYALHYALLVVSVSRLPEPDLSRQYYFDPEIGSATIRDSPLGYEAIAYVAPGDAVEITPEALASLPVVLGRLKRRAVLLSLPEVRFAVTTLSRLSRPEFTTQADFVHCVAAMEALLVPEPAAQTAKAFARRGGTVLAPGFASIPGAADIFKALYDLRSRLAHGDDPARAAEKLLRGLPGVPPLATGRWILCNLLAKLLRLSDERPERLDTVPAFVERLDAARADPGAYAELGLARSS